MHPVRIALLTTLLALPASAQVIESRLPKVTDQWLFSGSLFGGLPVGEFKNHEDGAGGIALMLGFQPWRRQPLVMRADFAGMQYGNVNARAFQDVCDAVGNCWTEEVTYSARNHNMMFFQAGPEFMATDGTWRPFGFALVGTTVFSSRATVLANTPLGPDTETRNLFASSNLSTAYGAGVRRVTTKHGREGGFELSLRVTRNAKARYLTESGMNRRADGTWDVSPREGAANVLGIHLGFWVGPHIMWNER